MMRWLATSCVVVMLAGCATFASKQEYRDYRTVRLATNDQARLIAMQRYVKRHPSGHWYDEVQNHRLSHEPGVFEKGKSTREGLEFYLSAFPEGVYAGQAKSRLSAISLIQARKQQETARAAQLLEARKAHDAELSRTWVTRFFGYWVKTLLAIGNWGAPIDQVAQANAEFSRAFGRPPRPRCTTEECIKYYESAFGVPVPGGTRVERVMRLALRLRMDDGKLQRAELLLPAWGFSRWYELEERRVVVDGDPEARQKAIAWALARALPLLDTLTKDPIAGYALAEIPAPAIGPSGELLDTTVEDPSAPPNVIQGSASPQAPIEELVKPEAPEQAPDMEMAPLQVGPNGQRLGGPEMVLDPVAVPPAGGGSPDMVLAPLAVPSDKPAAAPSEAAPAPQTAAAPDMNALPAVAPVTQAFRAGDLRIVLFAAGSDAKGPAYDGIVIERIAPERARGSNATKRTRK